MADHRARSPRAGKGTLPRCHTCGKPIRVPKGWGVLPAVRRHYWANHRDVMMRGRTGTS